MGDYRRPERYPERGVKERGSHLPRNGGTASGEPRGVSLVAGMKPTLVRLERTLRLAFMLLCALTQSAEPPYT